MYKAQKRSIKSKSTVKWNGKDYYMSYCPDHPFSNSQGYVYTHRLIVENYLGRLLEDDECVHHKDENKLNNVISNLELCNKKAHHDYHKKKDVINYIAKSAKTQRDLGIQKGENNPHSILTEKDVIEIRALLSENKYTYKQIGNKYNVSERCIGKIKRRETWKHIQ